MSLKNRYLCGAMSALHAAADAGKLNIGHNEEDFFHPTPCRFDPERNGTRD